MHAPKADRYRETATKILGLSLGWGFVAGFLELAVLSVRELTTKRGFYQDDPQILWMVPAGVALLVVAAGLPLAAFSAYKPAWTWRLARFVVPFVGFLTVMLSMPGLYAWACGLLAAGLAVQFGRMIDHARLIWVKRAAWFCGILAAIWVGLVLVIQLEPMVVEGNRRSTQAPAPANSPDVLLIVIDTLRADATGIYGATRETTPNLDRWSNQRGIRTARPISSSPWTLPSHATMFTGRWPHELGVGHERPLKDGEPTLAEILSQRGYRTAGFVANTFNCSWRTGLHRGFHRYEDYPVTLHEVIRSTGLGWWLDLRLHQLWQRVQRSLEPTRPSDPRLMFARKTARQIFERATQWIDEGESGRPSFAFLNLFDVHDPYLLPKTAETPRFGLVPETDRQILTLQNWYDLDKQALDRDLQILARDAYDDCLRYVDQQLGKFLDDLEESGRLESTWVIITSDHGEHFGEHELWSHGGSLYQAEIFVPLVILPPQGSPLLSEGGRVIQTQRSLRDLFPTILEITGGLGEFDPRQIGHPMQPVWRAEGQPDGPRSTAMAHVSGTSEVQANHGRSPASRGSMMAIVHEGLSYIRHLVDNEQLFDLENDPGEIRDRHDDPEYGERLDHLRFLADELEVDLQQIATEAQQG